MRFPWCHERAFEEEAVGTSLYPPGLDFAYETVKERLAAQQQRLIAFDTKAGVLVGTTAAAFGIVATNGGNSVSLFTQQTGLQALSLVILGAAFLFLALSVIVRTFYEAPSPSVVVSLANETPSRIKELSLQAMLEAYETNLRQEY